MEKPRRKLGAALLFDDEPEIGGMQTLPLSKLEPYPNHPFKLYEGKRLDDMVESVRNFGVLLPIIVRKVDRMFQILSGHNRANAARVAGLTEIPVIIKENLSEDDALLIVTETNLIQRSFSDLTHSERALSLSRHMDALRSQGKRTDLLNEIERLSSPNDTNENSTSVLLGRRLESRDKVAREYGLTPSGVARYLRIAKLSKDLLERVDSGFIGLYPAVSLSYLSADEQTMLAEFLDKGACKVDMKKAAALRTLSEKHNLNTDTLESVMNGEVKQARPAVKIKPKVVAEYFPPETSRKKIEDTIEAALKLYFEQNPQ
ncbi:chromosome partitioning protein ParB [Clostridia bacterium]|nr:chromosome partitioning protein ParB [Clostridia bacterium]